jgi:glycosyltransferase involved in cell wall biosynthesis
MKVCVISFKECWQNEAGKWFSSGGFPLQMAAVSSLFDDMILMIVQVQPMEGGISLPDSARVIPLRQPTGSDTRRKLSVLAHLPYYLVRIYSHIQKVDVVHVPIPGDIPFLGMVVALILSKYLIARYGGSWETTSQTTFMNRVTKACMRWFAGGRNVMLATGIGSTPPAPNMHWLYVSTISRDEIASIRPDLDRAASNPLRLAFIGRLSPEKGIEYLIRALSILKKENGFSNTSLRLTMFGDGPQKAEITALVAEEGLVDWVQFAGQLNRSDLLRNLLETDILVLPSLTEGFSKVRLEAMLCGVPVITTGAGFGRQVIGCDSERGWMVPVGDTEVLAVVLRHILTEPIDWPSLRRRCRIYSEGYTLEAWAESIGQICAQQWNLSLVKGKLRA